MATGFRMKYEIKSDYIRTGTKRRSGIAMPRVNFIVAHDTGNPRSTARNNVTYYKNSANDMSASAHIFVDDKEIIECIPLLTSNRPEKAWHVLYNLPMDNQMFGADSNDVAAGVEYCYGNNINADEAYKRYVWVMAYIAYKFNFKPDRVVGHHILDPGRKTDPRTGLAASGRTYAQLLKDVVAEYNACLIPNASASTQVNQPTTNQRTHVVVAGDSAWKIGVIYGVPHEDILKANGLTASSVLRIGQELVIPTSTQSTAKTDQKIVQEVVEIMSKYFADVPDKHYSAEHFDALRERGILSGSVQPNGERIAGFGKPLEIERVVTLLNKTIEYILENKK